jgi:hypothetical protein
MCLRAELTRHRFHHLGGPALDDFTDRARPKGTGAGQSLAAVVGGKSLHPAQ